MDKKIYSDTEYAIMAADFDAITGYRVVKVYREKEFAFVKRESDGRYGYLWLWTPNLDFTPLER